MKRKSLLFVLLLALMAPWAAMAQSELTVYEDGTTTNSYVPIYGTWVDNYTRSQFIMPAEVLSDMTNGTITSMTFYAQDDKNWGAAQFEVYMTETDATTLSSLADWNSMTKVMDAASLSISNNVMEVTLTNPYQYGGGNLLIGFYQTVSGTWSSCTWYGVSATGASMGGYGSTFSQQNFLPKTTFTYTPGSGPSCQRPDEFTAGNVTSTSAVLTWTGGSGTYNVEYKKASDETWTSALTNSTQTQFELSGLTPATNYQARVQCICGTDPETGDPVTSGWKSVSFRTECGVITTFPWTETFEDYASGDFTDPCWVNEHISGNGTSIFKIYTSTTGGNSTHQLQLPDMSIGTLTKLVLPEMNLPTDNYQFIINVYRSNSTYNTSYPSEGIRVFASTDGNIEGATELAFIPRHFEVSNNVIPAEAAMGWYEYELPIGISGTCYIILRGESQYCTATYMDNFAVQQIPTCPKPRSLAYSDVTGHTANLTWTPGAEGQTQWQICLNGDEDNLILVNSAEGAYTLTGLTGTTSYTAKVRAYCSETDQSPWSNEVSFTTTVTCITPTGLTNSNITNHSATLNWTSDASEWILAYRLYSGTDEDYVEVPVTEKPYVLDGLTPETRYIVRVRANCGEEDGLSTWSLTTNFTILEAYPAPGNVVCDSVFAYNAYFSWTERGTATDWEVAYKLATEPDDTYISEFTPNNHPFMLGELAPLRPGTDYVLKVRSVYFLEDGDTTSAWSTVVPFTTLQTCPAPTDVTVIDSTINAYGATLNWNSVYSDSWNVKYREPAYMIGTEEHFNTTSAPQGWTRYNALLSDVLNGGSLGNTTTSGWMFSNTNVFGAYHAKLNIFGTSIKYWLVSPELSLADGPAMSFDLALTDYNNADPIEDATAQADDKFVVLIYANDAWTILREWNNSGSEYVYNTIATTGEHVSIDLSAYQGQTVKIAFYGESTATGGDNDLHIDNVSIGKLVEATAWTEVAADVVPFELTGLNPETNYEVVVTGNCGEETSEESASVFFTTLPSCLAPTELVVIDSTITAHTATLSWTENGSATEWVIEYTGIVDGNAVTETINVTENPYTLTGLLAETPYAIKVKAFCGQGDESDWSNTVRFTTLATCPAPTDFAVTEVTGHTATMVWNGSNDSYVVNYRIPGHREFIDADFENGELPAGWTNEGAATWSVGTGDYYTTTGAHGGDYNAKINHGTTGDVTYLVTPNMDLSGHSDLTLGLWYVNKSWAGDTDGFGIYYRIDGGAWNEIFATTAEHSSWTEFSQALPAGAYAANCQFGFKFTDEYGYGVGLDDITLGDMIESGDWIPVAVADTTVVIEGLAPTTTYEARLQGVCDEETSSWTEIITFTTDVACPAISSLAVDTIGAHEAVISWVEIGAATAWQICVNDDMDNLIDVVANAGGDTITYTLEGLQQDADYTVKVRANCGEEDGNSAWSNAVSFHTLVTCAAPTNLVAENIGTESVTLTWEGESESYVVQYNPWEQVGDDQAAPATMTTFTFDLSDYSGMGSIAIRHYNISDIFSVNVDDIVVTNAQGETVFSENFEGSISSAISIMDLDGDGYIWSLGTTSTDSQGNPTGNGNYYVTSSSYDNNVGALTPDNWLVISDVELGGQLTFVARALDPEWTGDNFGVFVSAEEGAGEETVEGDNSIDLWDLTPNTSYTWQVKGVCGEDESQWASSFFTTLDDFLTFVTDGDWNDANNWNPAQVPTTDKNVHIEANAIIPAGVVAEANNVTINGGSITIKDGGQMKLNSQAEVVMEKEITGYGEGNGNYYLIASPFTGRTQFGASTWNHVDSLIYGTYDLYTFDPANGEDEEWVNYKANPGHIAYQSEAQGNQGLFEKYGYLYANHDAITLVFTGKINKNIGKTETKAIAYDANKGWALVGNIYACNAYLSFVDGEGEVMEANYWVMNAAGDDFELAETANGIAPITAAFVNFGADGYVQINSEEPTRYHRTGKFSINLSQDGNTVDKAVVRFGKGLNLEKMSLKNNSKLYFSNNDKDYAVVYSLNSGNMPVNFKAETAGSYAINCAADGVSFKQLVLIDNANGTKVDLLANPSYTFETEAGEFAGRFTIVYETK